MLVICLLNNIVLRGRGFCTSSIAQITGNVPRLLAAIVGPPVQCWPSGSKHSPAASVSASCFHSLPSNSGIVPIKSLYFEAGFKRLEPEEKYSGLCSMFCVFKWSYFSLF